MAIGQHEKVGKTVRVALSKLTAENCPCIFRLERLDPESEEMARYKNPGRIFQKIRMK